MKSWKSLTIPNFDMKFKLQWHSRLARRTYKSVLMEECEGREFEPLLEQLFYFFFNGTLWNEIMKVIDSS